MNELLNNASKNDPAICPNGCGHEYKELSCSWLTQLNFITQLDPTSCPNKCEVSCGWSHQLNWIARIDPAKCPNKCDLSCSWLTRLDWITQLDPARCPNKCGNTSLCYAVCPHNCGRSYKGFHRKQHLKRHLKYECGVRPQFQCALCKKYFTRNSSLRDHKIVIHGIICKITNVLLDWCATPDPAICPNGCGHFYRGINRKKLLRRHMVYECGVPSKFKCPICSKRFTRKSNMK
ncbi:hypothetical protein ACI65C_001771, partial [Semiaphis heraclei]